MEGGGSMDGGGEVNMGGWLTPPGALGSISGISFGSICLHHVRFWVWLSGCGRKTG